MEQDSKWRPRHAFLADTAGGASSGLRVILLDSSKVDRLAELRAAPAFREYLVEWIGARGFPAPLDAPIAQYFLLRHWEPPRSIFDEGDFLAGPFRDVAPADCARTSDFEHWVTYGLEESLIGLMMPADTPVATPATSLIVGPAATADAAPEIPPSDTQGIWQSVRLWLSSLVGRPRSP